MSAQPKVTIPRVESWLTSNELEYELDSDSSILTGFGNCSINIVDLETGKGIIERTEHVPARPRGRPTPIGKTPGPSTQCEDETMASERANRFGAHIERTPVTIQGTAFNEGSPFVGETGEHINGLSRLGVSPPGEGAESQVGDAKAT